MVNEQDLCCLVDPGALDPEVRSLGEHLAISRDLLTALADPMRQDLVQLLARAELNVGEIAERVTLGPADRFASPEPAAPRRPGPRSQARPRDVLPPQQRADRRHAAGPARQPDLLLGTPFGP